MDRHLAPPSSGVLRLIGFATATLGIAVALGTLGATTAQSATSCNNQGKPNPCYFTPPQDTGTPLASLKTAEPIPQDPQLAGGGPFIRNKAALLQLGKALFWDTQVGSDGQACASCHFSAGADPRIRNAVSPGMKVQPTPDTTFEFPRAQGGPNGTVSQGDFPIHKLSDPGNRDSSVLHDSNDTVGSQGVFNRTFVSVPLLGFRQRLTMPQVADVCTSTADLDGFSIPFQGHPVNVRRIEPRNTPTSINVGFQNRQFWDARAQEVFNGIDPFGGANRTGTLFSWDGQTLTNVQVRIAFASTSSQAVGPPTNPTEMSCSGRTFPDIARKLSAALPLGRQTVDRNDSVLGSLARDGGGLNVTYQQLIARAFNPRWWSDPHPVTVNGQQFLQAEANFSLEWGLAVGAYLNSLVADNTPLDQFFDAGGHGVLSPSAQRGLNIFQSFGGVAPDPTDPTGSRTLSVNLSGPNGPGTGAPADARCTTCHGGAEITNASIRNVHSQREERMVDRHGMCVIYDQGLLHTGVRPLTDDPLTDASDPFGYSFANIVGAKNGTLSLIAPGTPQSTAPFGLNATTDSRVKGPALGGTTNCEGNNITGAAKVPGLRNVELTGPFFHNGGEVTLMQVVDFYNRGGDFDNVGIDDNIHSLNLSEQDKQDLVNFMLALTDDRVAFERAPFDHPSICVPNGEQGDAHNVTPAPPLPGGGPTAIATDQTLCIRAVGAAGRSTRLQPFLNVNQFQH
jgi:cytochrome c peroxidase